ncbi:hypothetical protein [Haloprofundus halobius]|uniref:hypothetical protein n=1 Tax=Haloprofundus halobius TaxID=2876194 RepID=UPI001CCBA10F|nr:hypothetical protein [Haloprofundus halobius]
MQNDRETEEAVTVTVEREGETLYRRTHSVTGGEERTVAGFVDESLPEGEQEVEVCLEAVGESSCTDFRVHPCYGGVWASLDGDGVAAFIDAC